MKLLTTKRNEPDYKRNLKKFDMAVCEAISVSQEIAGQMVLPTVGYSTAVFTRMLAHAQTVVCTVPKSRWVKREFEHWDASSVAGNVRSILEGYLLFRYLIDAPKDMEIQRTYVQVMHI